MSNNSETRRTIYSKDARYAVAPAEGDKPVTLTGYALVWNALSSDPSSRGDPRGRRRGPSRGPVPVGLAARRAHGDHARERPLGGGRRAARAPRHSVRLREPFVRYCDYTDIRLDRTEWKVCCLRFSV